MSEWMRKLIEANTNLRECPFCHIMTNKYVEDSIKLDGERKHFIRCLDCQEELEGYLKNLGGGDERNN